MIQREKKLSQSLVTGPRAPWGWVWADMVVGSDFELFLSKVSIKFRIV